MNQLKPVQEKLRLPWIDAARGFAIFGIFIVNLPSFHGPYFLYGNGTNYWGNEESGILSMIIDIFFQASFYSLFSFLFGFGIQMMLENLHSKGIQATHTLSRRLTMLLVFGVIHAFLIWHGDILISYSIIGFLLLFFLNRTNTTLIIWSVSLLLAPVVLFTGLLYLASQFTLDITNQAAIEASYQHYGSGSILDILQQNLADWLFANNVYSFILIACNLLPIFLLGTLFARKKWLHQVDVHLPILKRIWLISLSLFFIFKAGPHFIGNPLWLSMLQDTVGGVSSAIFYIITITLLYRMIPSLFRGLEYVGKMALSNYILQSLVGVLLFYSIGFGLYGELSPLQTILIAFFVFPIQIILSWLWLKRYKRGPLEWVWRSWTYRKKLTNKRKQELAS
ncbi:DUF418 domain-containing protein [Gracilibacillus dipsosauri]|uniref:DUF418 domain-containing protein n=1 Tax=Gracilibacillus dipsosauri TaxID=178340 RepID=A0A317KWF6_9BACI|nr:DUF418 domain-containing protein [Gracilibacillus dipsosauri]PWU67755.1 DUF418 domain-containing protein [Gracilibacillus dipsosauri]